MKKITRILHVAEAAGGVERYLQNLFKFNDNQKIENIVLTSKQYSKHSFKDTVAKHLTISMAHDINLKKDIKTIVNIRKYIKKINPDIVYAHSSKAGALTRIANVGLNYKIIYNPHGWAFNMKFSAKKQQLYRLIEKVLALVTDEIVCISKDEVDSALKKKICKSNKLRLIYNGIDIDQIKNSKGIDKENLNIPKDAFVIGQVGRLSNQKAPDTFVRSAIEIKKRIPNAFFLMIGDGDEAHKINQLIKENNLQDSFLITGWVDNPADYIKVMNVATLLSRWEGFGLVLPEYMIGQVPVVANSVDAIPEIVKDGKTGHLVEVDNPDQVVDKIINIHTQPDESNRIIKNAYQFAKEQFNAKRVAEQVEKLYEVVNA